MRQRISHTYFYRQKIPDFFSFKKVEVLKFICVNCILLFVLCNFQQVCANEDFSHYENVLRMGNDAYTKGKYDSAVVLYESIVNAEFESASLYYNLGNAFYKMKRLPDAIWYYEKAKKIEPGDRDISFNLQLANQQIIDKIEPLPELFFTRWWKEIISSASVDAWAKWTLILSFYSFLMFAFFMVSFTVSFRRIFFISGIAGLFMAVLTFSFAFKQEKYYQSENEAIVFSPSVTTKSSPDETSTNIFVIHEGTKVKILEHLNGWSKITLPDGNIGWLKSEEIKAI